MSEDDRTWLERRVTQEMHCARNGTCPAAVRAHYQLLAYYLDQLYALEDESLEEDLESEFAELLS